ncbi:MAG: hypothetical protein HFG17_02915 [Oscillospiraceae bacterium]|nr:hypothetical protein [Oscillospiraceae bacterium]
MNKNTADLPMLTITGNGSAAMGFEGYHAYDISELVNENPWNENLKLSALPVYENPLSYDENFIVSGADFDAMKAFLLEIAARLGMDTSSLNITDNTPSKEYQAAVLEKSGGDIPEGYFNPTKVIAEENGIKIEVDTAMTAAIFFEPAMSLPDSYNFTHFAPYEDIATAAEYLKKEYQNLIGIDNPKINISGGGYNIYQQQSYEISFFDNSGDAIDQIIQYNFNPVTFYCDDDGKLFLIRIYHPDLSHKAGDYPIISAEEAAKLLLNGNYITTVPYEMPGADSVVKVELIYRTEPYEKYYMPYYRFYVELPPEMAGKNGLKDFGAYYVPAVEKTYLANMPVWNGSFNG